MTLQNRKGLVFVIADCFSTKVTTETNTDVESEVSGNVVSENMSEIAEITGFSSASYMAETFKKFYKMSPRDFKKKSPSN